MASRSSRFLIPTVRADTAAELGWLAEGLRPDNAPMMYLAAVLGLGWGECSGLRVRRLDFLRSTVNVA